MCQSVRVPCACQKKTSEIFFGKMVLDEAAVKAVYCPECGLAADPDPASFVQDNGWLLELDPDVIRAAAPRMGMSPETVTADQVFDGEYVTWVGFGPEDNAQRTLEREEIARNAEGNPWKQFEALREWAKAREAKFRAEGWRKARPRLA